MRSSFLPKHEQKIVRIPEILTIFRSYLGELSGLSLLYFSVLIHDNLIEQLTALHSLGGRVRFNAIRNRPSKWLYSCMVRFKIGVVA